MANNANPMKFIDISDVHSLMLRKEYLTKQYEDSKAALENFNKNLENPWQKVLDVVKTPKKKGEKNG